MSRVVVLIEHKENRRLLVDWLSLHHEVMSPESPREIRAPFDLGIVDGPSLERHGPWIEAARRAAHPVFVPFLLVTHRPGVGIASAHAWTRIDELIVSPVEKIEFRARVETLLRVRDLSVANDLLRSRLDVELSRARDVQASLLPRAPPKLRNFELAARCVPAREVSGDFFDWQGADGAAVLTVGDVMGKGVPAALLAATTRAALRAVARQNMPAKALDLVQESLRGDLERASSFVTLFHARLSVDPHEIRYVDAGHGHALLRRASGAIKRLQCGGRPLGFPVVSPYRESALELRLGDVLFVYSDGLVEGSDREPEELVNQVDVRRSAAKIVDQLIALAPQGGVVDDVTALVLKCSGADGAS